MCVGDKKHCKKMAILCMTRAAWDRIGGNPVQLDLHLDMAAAWMVMYASVL